MASKGPNLKCVLGQPFSLSFLRSPSALPPHITSKHTHPPPHLHTLRHLHSLPSHALFFSPRPHSRRSYLDKQVLLSLNKNRKVTGTLRGYDQFMNIVLGDASEETVGGGGGATTAGAKTAVPIGMVVSPPPLILFFLPASLTL